jgi:hypothetical protein
MTFDEQLRRAFETLTAHLHDEISHQTQQAIDQLAASAQAERDQAIADATRDLQPSDAGTPEPGVTPVPDAAALERLLNSIRAIDGARTLSDILDTLVNAAAGEAERVAVLLVRSGGYGGWRSVGFRPPFNRGEPVDLPVDASVIPLAIGDQTVAVVYFENTEAVPSNPALEILARHAARRLESVTAFKAARAALVSAGDGVGDLSEDASADDDAAARRYARLLVSEIKLYHEPAVVAGRRERDLGTRLGGEIARARVLYEQRVPPHIREHTDYFQDELVRTLANGDSTLLQLT